MKRIMSNGTNSSGEAQIFLISREGEYFSIERDVAIKQSRLIESIADADSTDLDFPLPSVSTSTLAAVTEFMKHYKYDAMPDIPKPLKSTNLHESVSQWYADFIKPSDIERLTELIAAANYMDIPPLLDLSCAAFASIIKQKDKHQLRTDLQIPEPELTEEISEEAIRKENSWAESV